LVSDIIFILSFILLTSFVDAMALNKGITLFWGRAVEYVINATFEDDNA
jgi:hypothetical protein